MIFKVLCDACGCRYEQGKGNKPVICGACGSDDILVSKGRKPVIDTIGEEWRHEMAMEEGMLHGVEAYNDAMGWGSDGSYDQDRDP